MNKNIAKQLNEVAATMPLLFKWMHVPEVFTGAELNLTPLGDLGKFEPDELYEIPMPAMVATEHKQQVKDAYKSGGLEAVKAYHKGVMEAVKAGKVIEFDTKQN